MSEMLRVKDIVNLLEQQANPGLAMSWDNVGLQIGSSDNRVGSVLLTLDITDSAIEYAIEKGVDLIISHHPLIFRPLKRITEKKYIKLIQNNIAVYCAHTNLDVVKNGVNFALAELLGLRDLQFLSSETGSELFQVAVYVPESSAEILAEKLFEKGAGRIGNYSHCLNDHEVSGQFIPETGSKPFSGSTGVLKKVVERKLEFFADSFNLPGLISVIKEYHPYETPVYSVIPQKRTSENYGLGLTGEFEKPISLQELALFVKQTLKAPYVKLWLADKNKDELVKKAAICGGSGTSLIKHASGRADVFISADFTYHTVLESKLPLIDAGHFYTEYPVLETLEKLLADLKLDLFTLPMEMHEIGRQILI